MQVTETGDTREVYATARETGFESQDIHEHLRMLSPAFVGPQKSRTESNEVP